MKTSFRTFVVALAVASAACSSATDPPSDILDFGEDFEQGLSQWVGREIGGHHAQIVADPLDGGNQVVSFTRTVAAGDLFTVPIPVEVGRAYTLTFRYLGMPSDTSLVGNLGGFLGISDGIPGDHHWLYGPRENLAEHDQDLAEDGQWHSYSVTFVPTDLIEVTDGAIRMTIEDGEGLGSLPGDAFFDDIRLTHPRQ